jgi:hypothetical protein
MAEGSEGSGCAGVGGDVVVGTLRSAVLALGAPCGTTLVGDVGSERVLGKVVTATEVLDVVGGAWPP